MTAPRARLEDYRLVASGKVRELYEVDDELLLLVASDRISAFDHVLHSLIPDKGRVLTAMSVYWFERLTELVETQLVSADDRRIPGEVLGRSLLVRRLSMLPFECVARGYLAGSGWTDYQATGAVCGIPLPSGLVDASQLPSPIFTPATKAERGAHDENVDLAAVAAVLGEETAHQLRDLTVAIYDAAARHTAVRGILLADTKLEFGLRNATLVLGDEALTPDSSRFWPADGYLPGHSQPSFDKQPVRDWLTSQDSGWHRSAGEPPPALPNDVVTATQARYLEAYQRITGLSLAAWPG